MTVTLDYDFKLLLPLNVDILGVHIGIPSTIHITRDSTFAISDLKLPVSP